MKTMPVLIVAIPLTAVLSAGGTVLALKRMTPPGPVGPAAPEVRSGDVAPPAPLPAAVVPEFVAVELEPLMVEWEPALPESLLVDAPPPPQPTQPAPANDDDAGQPPAPTAEPTAPAAPQPEDPAALGVDYLRLTEDIHRISDTLERFNRKLTDLLAGTPTAAPAAKAANSTPTGPPDQG